MPYKNKEDRTEAVRRYRDKQREQKARVKKIQDIDASLGNLLRLIGFEEMSFEELIECLKDTEKDEQGVWHDHRRGKVIYPPEQVFFGLNTLIAGNHMDDQIDAFVVLFQDILDYEDSCNPES